MYLLVTKLQNREDSLFTAAGLNYADILKSLIENGVDVNYVNEVIMVSKWQRWETALFVAARNGHYKCIELLVKHGATINYKNSVAGIY